MMKKIWRDRLTTVIARQGHYALDPDTTGYRHADLAVERTGDLATCDLSPLRSATGGGRFQQE
jgi:hypothetical protein